MAYSALASGGGKGWPGAGSKEARSARGCGPLPLERDLPAAASAASPAAEGLQSLPSSSHQSLRASAWGELDGSTATTDLPRAERETPGDVFCFGCSFVREKRGEFFLLSSSSRLLFSFSFPLFSKDFAKRESETPPYLHSPRRGSETPRAPEGSTESRRPLLLRRCCSSPLAPRPRPLPRRACPRGSK